MWWCPPLIAKTLLPHRAQHVHNVATVRLDKLAEKHCCEPPSM
ncbi:hypothetical protein NY08_2221 [Rhodococcus sp. B7740]|nr:hypothetical protein NY08_2221 [Rhodococcus sp. B7740]